MNELAEKVLYCLQMMRLIRWLTSLINDDYGKRVLARHVLGYLDAFLKLAPRLKNQVKSFGSNVNTVHKKLSQLSADYESFYATIRDKLTNHRQDLPLVNTIELWNEIDEVTVNIFIDDASNIYNLLTSINSLIPPFVESMSVGNNDIKHLLQLQAKKGGITAPELATDNLAFSRPNTVMNIYTGELKKRGSQIVSVLDTLEILCGLYQTLTLGKDTERLGKAMLIVDLINLIDNLYPYTPTGSKHKIKSFLEISLDQGHRGYQTLKDAYDQRDTDAESKLREVRNRIAAHVDDNPSRSLEDLLALLDSTPLELMGKVFWSARNAFIKCCQEDTRTLSLLCHRQPLVRLTRLIETGDFKPYSNL